MVSSISTQVQTLWILAVLLMAIHMGAFPIKGTAAAYVPQNPEVVAWHTAPMDHHDPGFGG